MDHVSLQSAFRNAADGEYRVRFADGSWTENGLRAYPASLIDSDTHQPQWEPSPAVIVISRQQKRSLRYTYAPSDRYIDEVVNPDAFADPNVIPD